MKKTINMIIMLTLIFSIVNINLSSASFIEEILESKTTITQINLDKYILSNPNLRNKSSQNKYYRLNELNKKVKRSLLNGYKNNNFGYYQMQGMVHNYSNFIYYSNAYFISLKNAELYGNGKEIIENTKKNFLNMVSYYNKFQDLVIRKGMN